MTSRFLRLACLHTWMGVFVWGALGALLGPLWLPSVEPKQGNYRQNNYIGLGLSGAFAIIILSMFSTVSGQGLSPFEPLSVSLHP